MKNLSENKPKTPVETPPAAPAPEQKADAKTEGDFIGRMQKAFDEALEIKLKAMEKKFDEMIEAKLGQLTLEAEKKLRASLGVEVDPVVHQSDLTTALRKALVEMNGKKDQAPPATEKAGPQGDKKDEDPFEALEKAAIAEVTTQ